MYTRFYDADHRNFNVELLNHILERTKYEPINGKSYAYEDRACVAILKGKLYVHQRIGVHYTSYDFHGKKDTVSALNNADVLLLAYGEDAETHPYYYYARVVSIFHVLRLAGLPAGWKAKRLFQVGFGEGGYAPSFSFIDPNTIIRSAHLIPSFDPGQTHNGLAGDSVARRRRDKSLDWKRYPVNCFADHGMVHSFTGYGPGHIATYTQTKMFRGDMDAAFGVFVPKTVKEVEEDAQESDHDRGSGDEAGSDILDDDDSNEDDESEGSKPEDIEEDKSDGSDRGNGEGCDESDEEEWEGFEEPLNLSDLLGMKL